MEEEVAAQTGPVFMPVSVEYLGEELDNERAAYAEWWFTACCPRTILGFDAAMGLRGPLFWP